MRPIWLIEAGVYGDEALPLLAAVRRQGMRAAIVPYQAVAKGALPTIDGQRIPEDGCVIAYGTLPFIREIQLHQKWRPRAWCNVNAFDCAAYFAHFGRYLLNNRYAMMPGVEAIRQRDWLFETFGQGGEVFARPTSCHKLFVGRRIRHDDFANALAPTRYDPGSLVVVAAPRQVAREWRLVVAGDRVLSGSQYAVAGVRAISRECPERVLSFARTMLAEVRWRPDPIFMLDVCESAGELRLVELNAFGCSWLYQCDLGLVVDEASKLAAPESAGDPIDRR